MIIEDLKNRKETLIALMNDPMYTPMKFKELAVFLSVPKNQRSILSEVLDILVNEGKIRMSSSGKYTKIEEKYLMGVYRATKREFGFVVVDGMDKDIFIPEGKTNRAMHDDIVRVVIDKHGIGKNPEGHIVEIIKRANETVVGFYKKNKSFGFVLPDNQKLDEDIFVPEGCDMGATTGCKVVVKILDYGSEKRKPEGKIIEVLGKSKDTGVDILSIIRAFGLPEEFPSEVLSEVKNGITDTVDPKSIEGRTDLRNLQTVTIDGEDAKDLDDAVTIEKTGTGYRLGVHIADVSEYVREGTKLDKEALERSTSVYLVDRVIPMLPKELSNGICSLNQGEDRLALSCIMDIDMQGKVTDHKILETVINVDRRMTYTAVDAIISNNDPEMCDAYAEFLDLFHNMADLSSIIRKQRQDRGSIDFDFPESKVILDEKGKPIEVKAYDRNAATKLIEDFMLLANETVAEDYYWQQIPFLYRTHDNPDPEKMKTLATFINNFGFNIRSHGGEVHPKELQKLLAKIEGSPSEALISRMTLRSMKQARYTTECIGHFGLATDYYTHFTSPIRRYPDLQIHRIIKENIHGGLKEKRIEHYKKILDAVALESSTHERRADEAERETVKYKKCEYILGHIGEEYDGVICGITNYGMYVELQNTIEGLVRVADIPGDYYVFKEDMLELVGEKTGKKYMLGDHVQIEIAGADKLTRTIDFVLASRQHQEDME